MDGEESKGKDEWMERVRVKGRTSGWRGESKGEEAWMEQVRVKGGTRGWSR